VLFAMFAFVLAVTGTYGVISYLAASRVKEFAIRSALGADRGSQMKLVLAHGLRLTAVGVTLGLAAALAVSRGLTGLPVTVRGPDLVTVLPVALLVSVVALAACLLPARRAATADPMLLLRSDEG